MKSVLRDLATAFPPVPETPNEARSPLRPNQNFASAAASGLLVELNARSGWWETGWFKEWERVARSEK